MVADWASEYAMGFNHDVRALVYRRHAVGARRQLSATVVVHARRQGHDATLLLHMKYARGIEWKAAERKAADKAAEKKTTDQ